MHGNTHTGAPLPQLSQHANANRPTKRLYQAWPGNNKFLFGGRLVFGPDANSLFLSISLIVTPATLFCVFVSANVIDDSHHYLCNLIPTASALFTAYIIVLLFLTSGRDPGIIPRNTNPPEPDDGIDTSRLPSDWIANQGTSSLLPPTKDVVVNGMVVKVKYCHTCMLYRPPRCSHCSICNNCVERFDHHCPWVGQCIGKRNYRFFFMFVTSTTVFCLYVLVISCLYVKNIMKIYDYSLWDALHEYPIAGVLIVYTFIGAWFVGGLTTFHTYLICTNQTTYENFRYRYNRKTNPHNLGLIRNVQEIFLSKIPSSKSNFRAEIKEHSSVDTKSVSTDRRISLEAPKPSILDIETGGRRQAVAEEEFEDIQSQIGSVASLERCGPQPRHSNRDDHKGNWEMTPDIQALATEFGMEHELTGGIKV